MTQVASMTCYRSAAYVSWAVEATGVLVLDEVDGRALELTYPQAAIWDFLVQGRPLGRVIELTALVAGCSAEAAHHLVAEAVTEWLADGWLAVREA